jgi:hypothetical protein
MVEVLLSDMSNTVVVFRVEENLDYMNAWECGLWDMERLESRTWGGGGNIY